MKAQKIEEKEIKELKVSSLPTRPTSPAHLGGRDFGPREMKAAFDRLPLYIIDSFNRLIEDIEAVGEDSLAGAIKTGLYQGHSLAALFSDIQNGSILSYVGYNGSTLAEELAAQRARLDRLEARLNGEVTK